MLDTVKLLLNDYEVAKDSILQVQPAPYRVGESAPVFEFPLFKDNTGREFTGSRAYLNTDKLNLTIQPYVKSRHGVCTFAQFSIPKVASGDNNFYAIDKAGTRLAIEEVENELAESGIKTKLDHAHISRIDTIRNVETIEPFCSYYSLFTLLKCKRGIQRGYGTTMLLHNTQQEFCIYDKVEELRSRGIDTARYPGQTMRFEHRLLNKAKVESVYGFTQVQDIFKGGWEVIERCQVRAWAKSLFSHSVADIILLGSQQLVSELRLYKDRYSRQWFDNYLRDYGAYSLAAIAGIEVVCLALKELESNRMKLHRAEKLLSERKRNIEFMREEPESHKTLAVLYEELRQKVCVN